MIYNKINKSNRTNEIGSVESLNKKYFIFDDVLLVRKFDIEELQHYRLKIFLIISAYYFIKKLGILIF